MNRVELHDALKCGMRMQSHEIATMPIVTVSHSLHELESPCFVAFCRHVSIGSAASMISHAGIHTPHCAGVHVIMV